MEDELADDVSTSRTLADLPHEILEVILSCSVISIFDVKNFACVRCKFREVCHSNKVWKTKFQQCWPNSLYCYKKDCNYVWRDECKYRFKCGQAIRRKIKGMSAQHFKDEEISNDTFAELQFMMEQHVHGYQFSIDELMDILNDGQKHNNLTEKYYVEKTLRFAKHVYLKKEWEHFLALNSDSQLSETGTILLAQWCQPTVNIRVDVIANQLDQLALLIKDNLQRNVKKHPVLESQELISTKKILPESLWTPAQCRSVLECINQVLFGRLGYQGNHQHYYEADNAYIDKVLERRMGTAITLCIMYASLAHRLGVLCEPVNFPAYFLLRWKEHPTLSDGQEYTYIDVYNKGKFMPESECVSVLPNSFVLTQTIYDAVPPVRIFQRMAHNLVEIGRQQNNTSDCLLCLRNALELMLLLQPDDTDSRLLLARVYLHLNINLSEVMSSLQHIQATDPTRCGIVAYMFQICQTKMEAKKGEKANEKRCHPQLRDKYSDVQFAVGMIMTHKRFHYACVIYGWDPQCAADNDWIIQMGVNNLTKKRYQPFYHVLVNDGSNRYAAQENLEIAANPCSIAHAEIGRYFSDYKGTHYLPNEEKANEYPQDEVARTELLRQSSTSDAM